MLFVETGGCCGAEDGSPFDLRQTFMIDANVSGVRRVSFVYAHDAG